MKTEITGSRNIIYTGGDNKPGLIRFNSLKKYESDITHCFTTRLGGVSTDQYTSLNLGFNRNDKKENVFENYKRVAEALDIDYRNMVLSNQVHDNKVRVVDESDRGKGIIRESNIIGYDALVTNKNNVALVTFYADCVPIFFYDPEKKVIALAHSGWRGTVKEIAKETVKTMQEVYGSRTEDIETVIGPSIGSCCFEVGNEVYEEFGSRLDYGQKYCVRMNDDKCYIDLQGVIRETLINSGIREEHICRGHVCTKCNNDVFFSHRGDHGKTGVLGAILQINP